LNPGEVGRLLRERREELGMEVTDIQQATKIRARYIQAIEEGDTSVLPAPVYAKGFVRAIANTLGLDGFSLMQQYMAPSGDRPPADDSETVPEQQRPTRADTEKPARRQRPLWMQSPAGPPVARPTQNRGLSAIILIVLVFVLLLGMGYAINYYLLSDVADAPGTEEPEASNPEDTQPEEPSEPSSPGTEPETEEPSSPEPPEEASLKVETTQDTAQNIITFELRAEDGVLPDELTVTVTGAGRCWLRTTSESTGEVLYEGTLTAGDEHTWTDPVGLRLRAGAPEAVGLSFNGIDLGTPVDEGAWTLMFRYASD